MSFHTPWRIWKPAARVRQSWHAYHVLGDVMRTGQSTVSAKDADFVLRLRARLQQEAVPLALHRAGDLLADDARASGTQARNVPPGCQRQ